MMDTNLTRRGVLAGAVGGVLGSTAAAADTPANPTEPFGYCLNTSTVRTLEGQWGKPRPILELIDIAAKAGYQAIEPWISELNDYAKTGGSLKDLGKRIADAGLVVPDAIGFAEWVVEDDGRRKKGLEQAKRDMDTVRQIGGKRLAAPPVGATGGGSRRDDPKASQPVIDLLAAADRYRELLELGQVDGRHADRRGVGPLEDTQAARRDAARGDRVRKGRRRRPAGRVPPLQGRVRLRRAAAARGRRRSASSTSTTTRRSTAARSSTRTASTPATAWPRSATCSRRCKAVGYRGFLSLELFNHTYWKQDPHAVAKTGLEKLKASVAKAVGGDAPAAGTCLPAATAQPARRAADVHRHRLPVRAAAPQQGDQDDRQRQAEEPRGRGIPDLAFARFYALYS